MQIFIRIEHIRFIYLNFEITRLCNIARIPLPFKSIPIRKITESIHF